jgi:hypothetical protein
MWKMWDKPGIIPISIPTKVQYVLKAEKNYLWCFNLYCEPDTTTEPDL